MSLTRRKALQLLLAAGSAPLLAACRRSPSEATMPHLNPSSRMPTIFLAHGSPLLLDDAAWMGELRQWALGMPRPRAVLMLSAHWEALPVTIGATRTLPLIYDFYGFPEHYYQVRYPAPGAPELAERVRQLLGKSQPVADAPDRGLDHGAYVPMVAMYPEADVPTLQVSLPSMDPRALFELGRALAPLRNEGVLIVGSGFLIHNLRAADFSAAPLTPSWASEFDAWSAEALAKKDVDALIDYKSRAPAVRLALPTHEHFVPVLA
jgi:4,5-DOPA dioxygenase extradiol